MAGAFNGNGLRSVSNDNNDLLYAARATVRFNPFEGGASTDGIEIGLNLGRSNDEALALGYSLDSDFSGRRELRGADVRIDRGRFTISGEYLGATLLDGDNDEEYRPGGYYAAFSFRPVARHGLHARWDSFDADGMRSSRDLAILGWTYQVTTPARLAVNLVLPSGEGSGRQQLLTQLQLYF
jgi:hypothetical protein